jgi:hypothetical protein
VNRSKVVGARSKNGDPIGSQVAEMGAAYSRGVEADSQSVEGGYVVATTLVELRAS